MPKYDEQIIQQFADQLYREARDIITTTALKFGFFALVPVGTAVWLLQNRVEPDVPLLPIGGVVIALAIVFGIIKGRALGFLLKVQAQQLLVQSEIERNTRGKPGID